MIAPETSVAAVTARVDTGGPDSRRLAPWAGLTALVFGALAGTFAILNTSIGWHLAAGRWMVEHRRVLRSNPFTFTADGVPWLDHEWLFQVGVALVDGAGGVQALVGLRMAAIALLSLLLARIARRFGLGSSTALTLAALCIVGARMRFYMRPELATLLLVPAALWVFTLRRNRSPVITAAALITLCAAGINLHAGILALLPLLAAVWFGDTLQSLLTRNFTWRESATGAALAASAAIGMLLNPWGWRVFLAPVHLAQLVGKPFVPNPEWISPGPSDVPLLFVGIVAAAIVMAFRERTIARWLLFLAATALALRYVRNVGLFFVLLPLFAAPSLARLHPVFAGDTKRVVAGALLATAVLAALLPGAPGFPFGMGYSPDRYPVGASLFLEENDLLESPIYNDVRFGGWLIGRFHPPFKAFIDDRNEIHASLLEELWEIENASSPARWQAMLDRRQITTALLRYRDPIPVVSPEGRSLGLRGFSALWFPASRWALVYWDDVSMVLVDRTVADPAWLARVEYSAVRADDIDHLASELRHNPEMLPAVRTELGRKLTEDPGCLRALSIAQFLLNPPAER